MLEPMPGYVLVELEGKFANVTAKTKVYEAATQGILTAMGPVEIANFADPLSLVGKRVFWTELVAGSPITRDGRNYVFLRADRIEGYEYV